MLCSTGKVIQPWPCPLLRLSKRPSQNNLHRSACFLRGLQTQFPQFSTVLYQVFPLVDLLAIFQSNSWRLIASVFFGTKQLLFANMFFLYWWIRAKQFFLLGWVFSSSHALQITHYKGRTKKERERKSNYSVS